MSTLKVRLISHTPEPEKVVAAAAKLCYASVGIDDLLNGLDDQKSREFVNMLTSMGHESPTEHASFTFGIEGVSRSLLAQITRHRHATFSVQSQRYVRLEDFEYVIPPEIEAIPQAAELYVQGMEKQAEQYTELVKVLEEKHFTENVKAGIQDKEARSQASKKANEDARFILPNACTTKMILTMNARSLNHFFHLRCCNRAQWEIQALADEMLKLVLAVAPALFTKAGPGCAAGGCTEGKMTCGKAKEVREKYLAMRQEAGAKRG